LKARAGYGWACASASQNALLPCLRIFLFYPRAPSALKFFSFCLLFTLARRGILYLPQPSLNAVV
jgi:hypothetical protein